MKALEGLERLKAREEIVKLLEEKGYLVKVEDYQNSVGECYRCKTVIEPYLSDQWFVKVKPLAEKGIAAVEKGQIKFVPERWTKVYLQWMTNLRDWCISRQLWWGHRIPAYYCKCGEIIVSETKPEKCPECGGTNIEQDPDVFDTWFSSALWPFSTLGWPDETKDLKTFYPTSVLVTGYDIITFWVSRMIMTGMHFMKEAPFHTVFIHGLVRDASGKKMSKSFGNVIDPIEIIDKVGADALRFALISLITGQGQDIKLTQEKITEARNFCNKIWNVSRFAEMTKGTDNRRSTIDHTDLALADKWIISRYQQTIKKVTELMESYSFGDAARTLYDFLWGEFCDWYVEISKIDLYSEDAKKKEKVSHILFYVLDGTLKLLHPFTPFITEEIWGTIGDRGQGGGDRKYIVSAEWPKVEEDKIDAAAEKALGLLMEIVTKLRNIKAEMGVQTSEIEIVFESPNKEEWKIISQNQPLIKMLAKASKIEVVEKIATKPEQSASGLVGDVQFFVPLKGLIDIGKERERLAKEKEKISAEMARLQKLLANNDFVAKATPEDVEKQRARLLELAEMQKIITARLADLS